MASENNVDRWVSLYQKYEENILNPSNLYLQPQDSANNEEASSEE